MVLPVHVSPDRVSISIAEAIAVDLKRLGYREQVEILPVQSGSNDFGTLANSVLESGRGAALVNMEFMPGALPEGLAVSFIVQRLEKLSTLFSRASYTRLQSGAVVACPGTLTRAQMLRVRKDVKAVLCASEVSSLTEQVRKGVYDACIVPAYCLIGGEYSAADGPVSHVLPIEYFVPRACQGAFALIATGIDFPSGIVSRMNHIQTVREVSLERDVLRRLAPAEDSAIGINCASFGTGYKLRVQLLSPDGRFEKRYSGDITGNEVPEKQLSVFSDDESHRLLGHT